MARRVPRSVTVDPTSRVEDDGAPTKEDTMHARVTTLETPQDQIDTGIERYRQALSTFDEIPGNTGALLLVDRETGKAVGITLWADEQALTDSREQADRIRQQAADDVGGGIRAVEEFKVAVWNVRP